jgi:hypothetical protein
MEYYVYKYTWKNEVVYIGKTTNLKDRINTHCGETLFYGIVDIQYFVCPNKESMDINEAAYIYIYKPKLNKIQPYINPNKKDLIITKPTWQQYPTSEIQYPLPYTRSFNSQQLALNYLAYFTKNNLSSPNINGTPIHFKTINDELPIYEYHDLEFILKDDFYDWCRKIDQDYEDDVGSRAEQYMAELCAMYPEGITSLKYLGNRKYQIN